MSWCLPCASLHHSLSSKMKKHAACFMKVLNSSSVRSKGLLHVVKKCLMLVNSTSCAHACSERGIFCADSIEIHAQYRHMCGLRGEACVMHVVAYVYTSAIYVISVIVQKHNRE